MVGNHTGLDRSYRCHRHYNQLGKRSLQRTHIKGPSVKYEQESRHTHRKQDLSQESMKINEAL